MSALSTRSTGWQASLGGSSPDAPLRSDARTCISSMSLLSRWRAVTAGGPLREYARVQRSSRAWPSPVAAAARTAEDARQDAREYRQTERAIAMLDAECNVLIASAPLIPHDMRLCRDRQASDREGLCVIAEGRRVPAKMRTSVGCGVVQQSCVALVQWRQGGSLSWDWQRGDPSLCLSSPLSWLCSHRLDL